MQVAVSRRVEKLRRMSSCTAQAALFDDLPNGEMVMQAAETLSDMASSIETRARQAEPVKKLQPETTAKEVHQARRVQSVRHGTSVYLPSWSEVANVFPTALLRTALFSASDQPQSHNADLLSGDTVPLVANKPIASLNNLVLLLSGYELCQFDRQIYAACLDLYRDQPLEPDDSNRGVQLSFYALAKRLGKAYSVRLHSALRASLMRLSLAQLRIRFNGLNLEVPKLLSVSFQDGAPVEGVDDGAGYRAADLLFIQIPESIAQLFGPGCWTALDPELNRLDGLRGWLVHFYATHSRPQWLSLRSLYEISGYASPYRNFRQGVFRELERLSTPQTPEAYRVSKVHYQEKEERIQVVCSRWSAKGAGASPSQKPTPARFSEPQ